MVRRMVDLPEPDFAHEPEALAVDRHGQVNSVLTASLSPKVGP